jgi:S-DNA-T family DNA segregation ATPase FtsK/SpoIIIE
MELGFGCRLFARFATDPEQIADLLDDATGVMRERAEIMQGRTPDEPLIVLLVDELASLTAYVTDRDLKRRLGAALPLLLPQGRAPGVVLVGAVQDPRKETVPFRDLFPLRVCLRTTEADHADLILGAGAYARGARADEIPEALPGVGYVQTDGQAEPVRVRAGHVTDDEIDRMATSGVPDPARTGDLLVPTPGGWVPVIPPAGQGEGWAASDGDGWAA